MVTNPQSIDDGQLILAAEDCGPEDFQRLHRFSEYEDRIIRSLMAHGPILLRGGRGSGKSALLMEAHHRLKGDPTALSVYLSLRHLPLLQSNGTEYQRLFTALLVNATNSSLSDASLSTQVTGSLTPESLRDGLVALSKSIKRRMVLFFDDAAHIGREADLSDFFGLFRTLSGNSISCKAAIYPGVTKFGARFDVFNDATVIDVARDERAPYFSKFFVSVIHARYPDLLKKLAGGTSRRDIEFATFLGRAVLGNMRSFVFACNRLSEHSSIGFNEITSAMLYLAADYYWPLLDELKPKLGIYEEFVNPSHDLAETIFQSLGQTRATSCLIHKDHQQFLAKPLEILEYVGFIAKREASRAMKSGGRGGRYAANLCNILDNMQGRRVTAALFDDWITPSDDHFEFHASSTALNIKLPDVDPTREIAILKSPIESLRKCPAYPYGLTEAKIAVLQEAGLSTIDELAAASDAKLKSLQGIGDVMLRRIRNVVYQAIWM